MKKQISKFWLAFDVLLILFGGYCYLCLMISLWKDNPIWVALPATIILGVIYAALSFLLINEREMEEEQPHTMPIGLTIEDILRARKILDDSEVKPQRESEDEIR